MAHLIGQTLGQYRIIEQIGQGGMATVYKAYQPSLDRYVAVKVLPAYFAHEPGFAMRFTREAKAIARLNHPNILPIHDFGQEGELSYIVMKYVEVGTLKEMLGQPLPLADAADILGQIAAALDHAHQRGILHRDVKPSNVLLDEGRWVLLSDFGLAKMVEGSAVLTASGVGVGTPAYMAPEQGRGEAVDARADIYSLGIVLYEMLTGRVPFEAETPMAVVIKHITDSLPLPRSLNPTIPQAVERVMLKALAKEPNDRFASTTEMADTFQKAVAAAPVVTPEMVPVPTVHPPPAAPSLAPETPAKPMPAITEAPPQPRRGVPWKLVGALAGILLLAVLTIVVIGNPTGKPTAQDTPAMAALATTTATEQVTIATRPAPTHTPQPPAPTHTPQPPAPTSTLLPTATPRPPTPTHTRTPTRTPRPPTPTPTPRPPTPTPTPRPPTPTPLPSLPGTETVPLRDLAPQIPWLPLDPNAIPATHYFGFNLSKPPFDNPLVRQAFALAVDRPVIADLAIHLGYSGVRPATIFTPPQVMGRDLYGQVGLAFDPGRARELLAQAGYPDGQGFPQVALAFNRTDQNQAVANAVIDMWRAHLGVQVTPEAHDNWNAYLELLTVDAPSLFRLGWVADINDPDSFLGHFASEVAFLRTHFSSDEFNRLIEQAAAAAGDPPSRQRLYIQAERILCQEEAVIIPLFHWLQTPQ
ncbi:MAG: protein kinase domain-containing protein [Chloroflexota bacterium]